jgi:hypothetical protein
MATIKTINDYKADYDAARARGDAAGMQAANDGANKLREVTGQAKEYATSDISKIAAQSTPTAQTPTATSATSYSGSTSSKVSATDDNGQTDWSKLINDGIANGVSADLIKQWNDQRNQKISENGALAQYANDVTAQRAAQYISDAQKPQYPYQFASIEEMKEALGYNAASAAEQAAIDAYIKQTVTGLESQKSGINQSADEAARQAYISYMQSQATLPQALAASGYSGGMADSQRLALDAGLQNNQKDITLNRDNALNGVDTAIQQAKLEGSIQGAQSQAQLGRDAISAFQQYMQQQNAYTNQDFWTKYGYDWQGGQSALDRQQQTNLQTGNQNWQSGENQADRDFNATTNAQKIASDKAWNIILAGAIPDDDTLAAAGISRAEAEAVAATVKKQATGSSNNQQPVNPPAAQTPNVTQAQYDAAADKFDAGNYSQEVIDTLLAAGDSPANLAQAAGFVDRLSLGYGPISDSNLAQKVASGEVEAINIGGAIFYRKKTVNNNNGAWLPGLGL